MKRMSLVILAIILVMFIAISVEATPSTHIWTPSTDIQPYGKIHLTSDWYAPTQDTDKTGAPVHVLQVYGPTFSLLSDKPENNCFGQVMAEAGFDYKKCLGTELDKSPLYFHYKLAVPEDAVMHAGTRDIVFVADPNGYFTPRTVVLGTKAQDYYEVLKGLAADEEIVTSGNFLVDSESKLNAVLNQMGEPNQPGGDRHD